MPHADINKTVGNDAMNTMAAIRTSEPAYRAGIREWASDDFTDMRRLRILCAASHEYLNKGFDGANVDDIAIAAGVGKATIYRFFNDKSDLFAYCILSAVTDMVVPLSETLNPDLPVEHALRDFAVSYIKRMMRPVLGGRPFYEMVRPLIGTSLNYPDLAAHCKHIFCEHLSVPLRQYFELKVDQGYLSGDPQFLCVHFTQVIFFTNSVLLEPATAPRPDMIESSARQSVDMFLNGCSKAA